MPALRPRPHPALRPAGTRPITRACVRHLRCTTLGRAGPLLRPCLCLARAVPLSALGPRPRPRPAPAVHHAWLRQCSASACPVTTSAPVLGPRRPLRTPAPVSVSVSAPVLRLCLCPCSCSRSRSRLCPAPALPHVLVAPVFRLRPRLLSRSRPRLCLARAGPCPRLCSRLCPRSCPCLRRSSACARCPVLVFAPVSGTCAAPRLGRASGPPAPASALTSCVPSNSRAPPCVCGMVSGVLGRE